MDSSDDDIPLSKLPKIKPEKNDSDDDAPLSLKLKTPKKEKNDSDSDTPLSKKIASSSSSSTTTTSSSTSTSTSSSSSSSSSKSNGKKVKKEKRDSSSSDDEPLSKKVQAKKKKKSYDSTDSETDSDAPPKKKKTVTKDKTKDKGKGKEKSKEKSTPQRKKKKKPELGSESEEDRSPKKKKAKVEETESTDGKKGKKKKEEEEVYKWWEAKGHAGGKKWKTLQHNGVLFPPPYKPHGVKMKYDGEVIDLEPAEEEAATMFATMLESPHMEKDIFKKNFFKDFRALLRDDLRAKIKKLSLCDFRPIHTYVVEEREKKKNRTADEKKAEKAAKEAELEKYGWAVIDGRKEKIGNFRVEPPGLFMGRGQHPKTGMLKKRIMPEDITINIGKDAEVPECPMPGHKWKTVIHDDTVTWLAMWRESINEGFKYVWLAASSSIKGAADMAKFDKARKLKKSIKKIRKEYHNDLSSKDRFVRQRATALWLIDNLALRVGNEKGEDEADTVGCCSLRVEHLTVGEGFEITLDFLGKDSMRYTNTCKVEELVHNNLKAFLKDRGGQKKDADDDIFDELTVAALNKYLKDLMPGLSAKVFRTYNASITLARELANMPSDIKTVEEKVLYYNRANRQVAILCNHQRSVPKSFSNQIGKIDERIDSLKGDLLDLEDHLAVLNGKMKKSEAAKRKEERDREREKKREEEKEKEEQEKKKPDDKKKAAKDDDSDNEEKKERKLPDEPDKVKARIEKTKESIKRWEIKKMEKDELKTVALGTSKINYMDPRITAAWCQNAGVPIEKIFSAQLRKKFPWAMEVDPTFEF